MLIGRHLIKPAQGIQFLEAQGPESVAAAPNFVNNSEWTDYKGKVIPVLNLLPTTP
jgi:hypothetical protein